MEPEAMSDESLGTMRVETDDGTDVYEIMRFDGPDLMAELVEGGFGKFEVGETVRWPNELVQVKPSATLHDTEGNEIEMKELGQ
jgi:hypothetical protein